MTKKASQLSRIAAALSVTTLFGCGGGATTSTDLNAVDATEPVSDWQLVWSDEFDGSSIDDNNWTHEVNCDGGGNNEAQCYTDSTENSFVSEGSLKIVAMPAPEDAQKPYTSARLNTRYKADFTYGRIEMRAKLPSGQGSWPAFWMLPTDDVYGGWPRSGEIDILEAVNLTANNADGEPENHIHATLHYGQQWPNNDSSGKSYSLADGSNPTDDFHTYAIEWQEGEIRWYMDNYLYATQRRSEVRYNASGEPSGLSHRGWYAEYYEQGTGELTTHWDNAPFDQAFHLILNFAVGGDWPEAVNETGIDAEAFAQGQTFEIDYVRVYECGSDPDTGKGCETVRPGYDSLEDALVEGAAPIPTTPSTGAVQNLAIFDGTPNPSWPAWDCCGGTTPELVDDAEMGSVYEFSINETPTVMGFISREPNITDPQGEVSPFDASGMKETGSVKFDLNVTSLPSNATTNWLFKIESSEGATFAEVPLMSGYIGPADTAGDTPAQGVWESYEFPLSTLAAAGLDTSAIDVVMVFPAWDTGNGAVYRLANVEISVSYPELTIFEDAQNPNWPMWDCCGGSTPTEEMDNDAHGLTAEFRIGAEPTVMGFTTRSDSGGGDTPFDATALTEGGLLQFDMRVVNAPNNADAAWLFKIESNDAATAVELPLSDSVEGQVPVEGEWQTYTFTFSELQSQGLDVSAIDVVMVFPAWGAGEGAVYRIDNVRLYHPDSGSGGSASGITLFADTAADQWSIWDCCGGSTPTEEVDDAEHGTVAEFRIGGTPTVMGFLADENTSFDASSLLSNGTVRFEMKVSAMPNDAEAPWLFKIESIGASTAVELPISSSIEGSAPVEGEWQTYTFPLQTLYDEGLDISAINVVMMFPAWGQGEGAVYRVDNVEITAQ